MNIDFFYLIKSWCKSELYSIVYCIIKFIDLASFQEFVIWSRCDTRSQLLRAFVEPMSMRFVQFFFIPLSNSERRTVPKEDDRTFLRPRLDRVDSWMKLLEPRAASRYLPAHRYAECLTNVYIRTYSRMRCTPTRIDILLSSHYAYIIYYYGEIDSTAKIIRWI